MTSESRSPSKYVLLAMGVAWLAFAVFDFYDAHERGGLAIGNPRFIRACVALVLGVGAFIGARSARRAA